MNWVESHEFWPTSIEPNRNDNIKSVRFWHIFYQIEVKLRQNKLPVKSMKNVEATYHQSILSNKARIWHKRYFFYFRLFKFCFANCFHNFFQIRRDRQNLWQHKVSISFFQFMLSWFFSETFLVNNSIIILICIFFYCISAPMPSTVNTVAIVTG